VRKLFKLNDRAGIVSYGQGELAAQMIVEVQKEVQKAPDMRIPSLTDVTRQVLRTRCQEWFKNVAADARPALGFILGGIDEQGVPRAYYLTNQLDFAPQLVTTGVALGGVPQYAIYLAHRLYNPEMTRQNLLALAIYLISETATQDPKVGGPIRVAEISADGGYSEITPETIKSMTDRNEDQTKRLREFFFGGQEGTK
jgi:20S proteasome alpha/beta subunit